MQYLEEAALDKPQPIMIDEFDEMQIVIESDDDSDNECTITGSTETSNVNMKWEYLYNLKKEIKVKVLQHTLAKSED